LHRKAPCHRDNKNSIADAVILETYLEAVKSKSSGERFAFVTDNVTDFSLPEGNHKLPHSDFAGAFSKIKSMYFINQAEYLRRVDPSFVSEVEWLAAHEQPCGIAEIMKAHELLYDQIWYGRHNYHMWEIEKGTVKVVTQEQWDALIAKDKRNHGRYIVDKGYKLAQRAGERVEARRGKDTLGPWDAFEWGMLNGKLSAIRWMLGDEWDMLDT
jgi:hypothetical protein